MRLKKYNFTEALQKLRRYCAYQERCHREVKTKLWDWGFNSEESGSIIVQLMEENFLNEERFAKAITGGRFRQKGWGKNKITAALKTKGILPNLIASSLKEINPDDYLKTLKALLLKKSTTLKETNPQIKVQKLARFAISKGYEPELVWENVKDMG
jgi:regulatory protein